MSTIQIRIDPKTKKSAQKVLGKMGLDFSSAIKLYFYQVILTESIPFPILTENGLTLQQEQEILKASEDARQGKNISKPMNIKQALAYLDKLKKKK